MGLENPLHLAFLLVILLLVFGAKRLPEMGRSLGSGMRDFKDALSGETKSHTEPAEPTAAQSLLTPFTAGDVAETTTESREQELTPAA